MDHKSNQMTCAQCEAMLLDALDGILTTEEQLAFDHHLATCNECSNMATDARRGAALLEVLKPERPEPSADLVARIIAQTSGSPSLVPQPAVAGYSNVIPMRSRWGNIAHVMLQPRSAMTAAMAFFSLALSANLVGLHPGDFSPSNVERTFYHAQTKAIQFYDNLGVVEQMQSRVRDLRRVSDEDQEQSTPKQQKDSAPSGSGGSSQRELPAKHDLNAQRRDLALPWDRRSTALQGVQA